MLGRGSVLSTTVAWDPALYDKPPGFFGTGLPYPASGGHSFASLAAGSNTVLGVLAAEPPPAPAEAPAAAPAAVTGSPADGSGSSGLSGGAVAGVAVGAVAGAALLAGGAWAAVLRRRAATRPAVLPLASGKPCARLATIISLATVRTARALTPR